MQRRKTKAGEVGREGLGAGPATHTNEGHGGLGPFRPAGPKQAIAHGSRTVDCPSHPNPSVNAWRSVKF